MNRPAASNTSKAASELERRAARAELLLRGAPAAEAPLAFAAGLYRAQASLAAALEAAHVGNPLSGHLDRDVERFFDRTREVLRFAAESGPRELAEQARAQLGDDAATAHARLAVYWAGDRPTEEDYLSRALLRPYVEVLRAVNATPDRVHRHGRCPFCGGAPWVSARRDGSTMEGARRMLACSLCGGEWLFGRILCPACFEEDPGKLPSFKSDVHPTVRIEVCDVCKRYIKSLDLSEDARPVPEVDDLVSIAMDLWAIEQGFTRIEPGLAGI
ncbi:MAG TPA: formate dehydrogenase accessory protein FdhE [Thermoanaerobaculia bacterium]|nr:formate dehydrogenase accessory protein FdhE [Thermoanaerobaculia bacterium]